LVFVLASPEFNEFRNFTGELVDEETPTDLVTLDAVETLFYFEEP